MSKAEILSKFTAGSENSEDAMTVDMPLIISGILSTFLILDVKRVEL
jgi:hypothetical protein